MAAGWEKQRRYFLICLGTLFLLLGLGIGTLAGQADRDQLLRIDAFWKARQPEHAQALVDSLLPGARTVRDTTMLINLLGRRGKMYGALGRSARAEAPLRETLALARARADTFYQCTALRWLAVSLTMQGRYEEGGACYCGLARLARASGRRDFLGWGLAGEGYYRSLEGDEDGAQEYYRQASAIFHELGLREAEHFVLLLLGESLTDQGAFPEARRCYERTGEIGRQTGDFFLQGLSFSNRGLLEIQVGDPQAGMDDFREASRLFRLDGSVHEDLAARLQVVRCLVALQMDDAARRKLVLLKGESEAGGFGKLLEEILALQSRLVNAPEAVDRVSLEVRAHLDRSQPLDPDTRSRLVLALAELIDRKDGPRAALDFLESRLDSLTVLVSVTEGLELRLAHGRLLGRCDQPGRSLEILITVANQSAKLELVGLELQALPPAAVAAEAMGDQARALSLLQRASDSWLRQRSLPVDPYWREVYGTQSRNITTRLASLLLRDGLSDQPDQGMARAFDAVQIFKARTLQERMAGPGVVTGRLRTVTLQTLQHGILQSDEIMLDCFLGQDEGLIFVVDRDHCRVVRIPGSREIGPRLRSFHQFLANPHRPSSELLRQVTREVVRTVFQTALDGLPRGSRIFFSPDGDLNLFPLVLALDPDQGPVSRVPSASILDDLRNKVSPRTVGPATLLVVGSTTPRHGEELPAIGREMAFLGGFREARVRTSLDPDNVNSQLSDADVLHFATHAQAVGNSPWQSYLEIPAVGDTSWFQLDARAIAAMRLPACLAVLAGCESAAGRVLDGEGVQSLANAFLGAGVSAVLATLWPVDDQATALLVNRFYSHLALGMDTAQSLRLAQGDLAMDTRYADPFFWAGFVVIGNGIQEIPLERQTSWHHYLLWMVPTVVMLVFLATRLRRRPSL
ncbi:MAG: CHAT domain-containing protein [Candidatus Krumholzibacteria bacterium]|nr:CHAT domain-containing protein [Candidatus Krumholzibacteria bacterium]